MIKAVTEAVTKAVTNAATKAITPGTRPLSEPPLRRDVFVFLELFEGEGGIQTYNRVLLESYGAIAGEGTAAEVLVLRDRPGHRPAWVSPGLHFHGFLRSRPDMFGRAALAWRLVQMLLVRRPQRVFCGHIKLARLVRWLCRPLGIPYTVLTYGKEVWSPLSAPERAALAAADQIWTISRYSRDRTCEANNLPPERLALLPCCIDATIFTPGPKPQALLDRYRLHGAKVLMTVARLWSGDIYKGVDVTLRALPEIAQAVPTVKYLVIGRGDDRPRLEQLAQELGVSDRVVFAGFVADGELPDHYRVADVYVMPSQEGFGIVYLEAMASGIPAIGGDNDGSADPLQDGRVGWQVPHRDPTATARACIAALAGDDCRCDGAWLREAAIAGFGKGAFTEQLRSLLEAKGR